MEYFKPKINRAYMNKALKKLTEKEKKIFLEMSDYDKFHSLEVYKKIKKTELKNNENLEIENSEIKIDDLNEQLKSLSKVRKIEKNSYFTVFFVEKKDKGEFIGKRGKNIRKLKKIFGDIVVKEI